jgi:hypothetical protein
MDGHQPCHINNTTANVIAGRIHWAMIWRVSPPCKIANSSEKAGKIEATKASLRLIL